MTMKLNRVFLCQKKNPRNSRYTDEIYGKVLGTDEKVIKESKHVCAAVL